MKKIIAYLTIFITLSVSQNSTAASQDECAIWLCLPAAFAPAECSSPHRAFKKRVLKGKSPLPSMSSCKEKTSNTETLNYKEGVASHYTGTPCLKWGDENDCKERGAYTDYWVHDRECNEGDSEGKNGIEEHWYGCKENAKYVVIYDGDIQIGDPTYHSFYAPIPDQSK